MRRALPAGALPAGALPAAGPRPSPRPPQPEPPRPPGRSPRLGLPASYAAPPPGHLPQPSSSQASRGPPARGGQTPPAARGRTGRLILAANRSRRLTTPHTCRPSTTGRWRNPFRNMIWPASSTGVSGPADCGSGVIQAEDGTVVRSVPDAAALSTSRSVRMPLRKGPCMMKADPTFSRTIAAATSATGLSGAADTTLVFISSPMVTLRRPGSATLADLVQFRVALRGARSGHLLGQQAPEGARPGREVRPPHPEELERRLVEFGVSALGSDRVTEVFELVD